MLCQRAAAFLFALAAAALLPTSLAETDSPAPESPGLRVIATSVGEPNPAETLVVQSAVLGETRRIYVQRPHGYEKSARHYPVLVVLDGEWLFDVARAHARFYSEHEAMDIALPPMIVVGIENSDRDRDFTPTPDSGKKYVFESAGHAARFLEFLESELLPLIDARYRTVDSRTLAGWSFGGLFTVHAATTRPALFDAYLCISPAVWWDSDLAVERLRTVDPERAKRLVVTLGSEEDGGWVYVSSQRLLASVAAEPITGLEVSSLEFPGVGHTWSIPAAFDAGLRRLFDGYIAPDDVAEQGLAALDAYYERLSERWHFDVPVAFTVLQSLLIKNWKTSSPEDGLALAEEIVRRHPLEPSAHYFLGRRLTKLERHDEAIAELELAHALEIGRTQPRHLKALQFGKVLREERERQAARAEAQ